MNSIDDLREIYDELYRSGEAAAAARTTRPAGTGEHPGATNVELLPAFAVQPARARQRRGRLAPLATAATVVAIVALIGGAVLALRPWSHHGGTPAGADSSASSVVSTPSVAVRIPAGPGPVVASPPLTGAGVTTADPSQVSSSSARCYATADVGRTDNYFSITLGGDSQVVAGPLALELCGRDWRDGILSANPPYKVDDPADHANLAVPELVACVLPADNSDEGVAEVAVLPGPAGTCSDLGLAVFPGGD